MVTDESPKILNLTNWHCLKATWYTQEGTISAPSSGNIIELSQMLLWNHPYAAMKSFLHGLSAYNETRGLRTTIPLNTTTRALGLIAQKPKIHLLLPDWEAGHLNLNPRSRHSLEELMFDQDQMKAEEKSIDLQIPMQLGQTCLEAILLTLQIVGCQQGIMHKETEGNQVFTTNHIPKGGPRHLEPTVMDDH